MSQIRPLLGLTAAALGVALACAKPLPTVPPLSVSPLTFGSGQARQPDHVVVITDGSGTMYARQTFPLAKALTQTFVAGMPNRDAPSVRSDYQTGLVGFGGDDREVYGPAPFDRGAMMAAANGLHIMGDIDGMGGRTPFHDVFHEVGATVPAHGEGMAAGSHQLAVVVFSDGLPDWPDRALAAARSLAETFDGQVCFHTVQTGDDPAGTEYMKALAALTSCGSYRTAASVNDPGAFMNLERDVFSGAAPVVDACGRTMRLQGVTFDFDKADIKPDSAVVLDVAADQLKSCPGIAVRIEGHTDSIGTEAYNQDLSVRRAKSVQNYLQRAGLRNPLTTVGLGESNPVAPNKNPDGSDNPEGRAQNRRVELHPGQ